MESEEGTLKGRIEAILFVAGEAVSGKELARAPVCVSPSSKARTGKCAT